MGFVGNSYPEIARRQNPNLYRMVLKTAPDAEPVAWEELRDHMRLDGDADKAYVEALEQAARFQAEQFLDRSLITQAWQMFLDDWPCESIVRLPRCPVTAVVSVKYVDTAGATQTLVANTDYVTDLTSEPARIVPAYGKVFPPARDVPNAVIIEYTAGYGGDGSAVPEGIKHAIKFLVAHLYENREPIVQSGGAGLTTEMPMAFSALLWPYRVF